MSTHETSTEIRYLSFSGFRIIKRELLFTRDRSCCTYLYSIKMGQSRPLFVYFHYFLDTISIIQIEKSVDGVLGI